MKLVQEYSKDQHNDPGMTCRIKSMKSPKNKPEDICKCLHAGTLSECFGGTTISMRVQRQSVVSCFIRHPDGRVTCPMGQELFKHRKREHGTVNGSREARRTCPNRCTDSHKTKPVSIGPSRNIVAVRMYGHPNHPSAAAAGLSASQQPGEAAKARLCG